ncbi:hypothetical protein ACFYOC_25455 [Nocardiopsis alba]|uniref:hypothetical protein n=1 Tax=Nocardiopsis alba TaxID=53437 RepID=UPI0036CE579C
MSLSRVLLAAGAVVLLSACSTAHEYDQAAFESALAEIGVEVTGDMDTITEAMERACESDDPVMFAVGFLQEGGNPDVLRIGVEHVCPDRADEFADVVG